jgi:hypothetical protein
MPTRVQRAFAYGEWSPERAGRADRAEYYGALRTCRNFLIQRAGGLVNRAGFRFLEVVDADDAPRLFRFVLNATQGYLILATAGLFTIYRNGSVVETIVTPYSAAEVLELQPQAALGVMTFTHPNHAPRELTRSGDSDWLFVVVTTAPTLSPPGGLGAVKGSTGTLSRSYQVTAMTDSLEESIASAAVGVTLADLPTEELPHVVSWAAVSGAAEYNVYCDPYANGVYGFIGSASGLSFRDVGAPPDFGLTPPKARTLFASAGNYPAIVGHVQQRRIFGASTNDPQTIWASKTGFPRNFSLSSPLQDDDALTWRIFGTEAQIPQHILPLKTLVILTTSGVWLVKGDESGALIPSSIRPDQVDYHGAHSTIPIVVGSTVVYVQVRGRILRDLQFDQQVEGFAGRDLTMFANHLFDAYTLEQLAYAETPHSIVWSVRSDGTLLALTYILDRPREQRDEYGWSRHDTQYGAFESVCVVQEEAEDVLYAVIRRTIDGSTRRTLEQLASRTIRTLATDAFFVDGGRTQNGWNTDTAVVLTLETSGGWTVNDLLTVSANTSTFEDVAVGDAIVIEERDADGLVLDSIRVSVEVLVDFAEVRGYPVQTVPTVFQDGAGRSTWGHARRDVSGLAHLRGAIVSVLGDGSVVFNGNPDHPVSETFRVSVGGSITLPRAYVVTHVGLPIEADAETLDLDAPESDVRDRKKAIQSVALLVESSRGVWAGIDASELREYQPSPLPGYDSPPPLVTGKIEVTIPGTWTDHGRVFIRQRDPLPLSLLGILSHGGIGG